MFAAGSGCLRGPEKRAGQGRRVRRLPPGKREPEDAGPATLCRVIRRCPGPVAGISDGGARLAVLELRRALGGERVALTHEDALLEAALDDDLAPATEGVGHDPAVGHGHRAG